MTAGRRAQTSGRSAACRGISSWRSFASYSLDRSERAALAEPRDEIVEHDLAHVLPGPQRRRADVWGEHHVVHGDELGRHARLVGEHVEARGEDALALQRLDQRRLIDDGAT